MSIIVCGDEPTLEPPVCPDCGSAYCGGTPLSECWECGGWRFAAGGPDRDDPRFCDPQCTASFQRRQL